MTRRTGSADLPLHGGRVPTWLASRMAALGAIITQAIVHHYGRDEFLQRLAHPFWFQSFDAVMGMDWHSSGITTSVIARSSAGNSRGDELSCGDVLFARLKPFESFRACCGQNGSYPQWRTLLAHSSG